METDREVAPVTCQTQIEHLMNNLNVIIHLITSLLRGQRLEGSIYTHSLYFSCGYVYTMFISPKHLDLTLIVTVARLSRN